MSQNNLTIIYAGLDIAKARLQLHLGGHSTSLPNDPQGHQRLLRELARAARPGCDVQVILEASGGYEQAVVAALHAAGRRLTVIQPARARSFARAQANHAKTDPIDAALLADFGQRLAPPPTPPPTRAQSRVVLLVGRRSQLVVARVVEINRAQHYTDPFLRQQSRAYLALLGRQIAACETAIAAQLAADPALHARATRVQEVPGVGPIVAAVLQAHLPELGTLNDREVAALAGLAPYNRDSGAHQGVRFVRGGRTQVRCALYLAAMSAIRHDPVLRTHYQRLRRAGKVKMVALTAVMRKLIVLLNRMLRNPDFKLQRTQPVLAPALAPSPAPAAPGATLEPIPQSAGSATAAPIPTTAAITPCKANLTPKPNHRSTSSSPTAAKRLSSNAAPSTKTKIGEAS